MPDSRFLVVCLNPTLQVTLSLPALVHGQVNRATATRRDASGKGVNVARVLRQLGEEVVHLTHTGGRYEAEFLSLAREDGLDLAAVSDAIQIRHCYTLLGAEDASTTEIVEAGGQAGPPLESRIRARYEELLPDSHTVIISGSKAPGYSAALFPEMVRLAKQSGARVLIDFRGEDLRNSIPFEPDLVKINVSEFAATYLDAAIPEDLPPARLPEALEAVLVERSMQDGIQFVLTNGRQPVMFAESGRLAMLEVPPVEVVNTIGAGDAVTAGVAAGLHHRRTLREAIALGIESAGRNVRSIRPGHLAD